MLVSHIQVMFKNYTHLTIHSRFTVSLCAKYTMTSKTDMMPEAHECFQREILICAHRISRNIQSYSYKIMYVMYICKLLFINHAPLCLGATIQTQCYKNIQLPPKIKFSEYQMFLCMDTYKSRVGKQERKECILRKINRLETGSH